MDMELNKNYVKGKWAEIKGEVRKAWGKLTDDELEQTKGDVTAIRGLIQQKYGKSQERMSERLDGIFQKFNDAKERGTHAMKTSLRH